MRLKKGFTLVEVVVVIAIMGILTVIIIPSLNNARSRNRDTERVADIGTIQLGLLNYYTKYGYYPTSLDSASTSINQYIVASAFLDPNNNPYTYVPLKRKDSTKCTYYHLGATLESQTGQVNNTDNFSTLGNSSNQTNPLVNANNYVYCGGYTGPGLGTSTLNYNVHP